MKYLYYDRRIADFRLLCRRSSREGMHEITFDALCAGLKSVPSAFGDIPHSCSYLLGSYISVVDDVVCVWDYLPLCNFSADDEMRIYSHHDGYHPLFVPCPLDVDSERLLFAAIERKTGYSISELRQFLNEYIRGC